MAGRKPFDDLRGKMPRYQELAEAARALLPYLETSTDPKPDMDGMTHEQVTANLQAQLDSIRRSEGEKLRDEARKIDAKEAAIWRFRKAVEQI